MEDRTDAPAGTAPEVHRIRAALTREFAGLLDLEDVADFSPESRERVFLSRALAAKAVQLVTDCPAAEAAEAVVDGSDDHGIDAVMVSPTTAEVWLIQAKWSDWGKARLDSATVLKMLHGLQQVDERGYHRFNAKFQRLIDRVDAVLRESGCRVHLVLAVLGPGGLSQDGAGLLIDAAQDYNRHQDMLDFRVLGLADFHAAARPDAQPAPVSVTVTLSDGWHAMSTPHQTYLGAVAAEELAGWYEQHGARLFEQNVRHPLGLTSVNVAITNSLLTNPHEFLYLNNGITVLCDSVRTDYFARRAEGRPARLVLTNARVVNGAQTVSAVHRAFEREPETVAEALVMLRVICLDGAPADLAPRISRATNTQNRVEARDFIALDPQQELIRQDFALSLDKSYVLRRGESDPAPAAGCSVVEAAIALACAHPDAGLVARVLQDSEVLWRGGSDGVYERLFGSRPGALQIWRSVGLLRRVRDALAPLSGGLEGRGRLVAERADLLVAHIAFQLVGSDGIEEPGDEWNARLESTVQLTGTILSALIDQVSGRFSEHAFLSRTLREERSCRLLASEVLRSLQHTDDRQLAVPLTPGRRRRPNAVPLLVERGVIEDGTQLLYRPTSTMERQALHDWLSEAPERYLATWVNDRRTPLVWAVDGQRYSPTGLVRKIWEEAQWAEQPVAVAGPRCWSLPGEGTLSELAANLLAKEDVDTAGDGSGAQ